MRCERRFCRRDLARFLVVVCIVLALMLGFAFWLLIPQGVF